MSANLRRPLLLAALLGVLVGLYASNRAEPRREEPRRPSPIQPLIERYGPKLYSQHNEELLIRHFFNDRRGGRFLDVGANHYKVNSTTYFLEEHLGWSGIAIDALPEFAEGYRRHRPRSRYFARFVSDVSDDLAPFYVIQSNHRLSSGAVEVAARRAHETIEVPTITLNDLLDGLGVERIDFLSMDIERWEPKALAGFDIERFRPELVCIEAHEPIRDELVRYFDEHGYVRIEAYLPLDPLNWYYRREDVPSPEPLAEQS